MSSPPSRSGPEDMCVACGCRRAVHPTIAVRKLLDEPEQRCEGSYE